MGAARGGKDAGVALALSLTAWLLCLKERKKMEEVLWNLQRKHEDQIANLQATVDRLLEVGGRAADLTDRQRVSGP